MDDDADSEYHPSDDEASSDIGLSDSSDDKDYGDEDNVFDLDDEEVGTSEEAEEFVELLQDSATCNRKMPQIKLCEYVKDMISDASKRSELSGNEEGYEYKLEQGKIHQCLQNLLEGVGGPDESVDSKLYQLYVHRSLDDAFEKKKMPRNLFSFYLMHTRVQRDVRIQQLEMAKK